MRHRAGATFDFYTRMLDEHGAYPGAVRRLRCSRMEIYLYAGVWIAANRGGIAFVGGALLHIACLHFECKQDAGAVQMQVENSRGRIAAPDRRFI